MEQQSTTIGLDHQAFIEAISVAIDTIAKVSAAVATIA